MLATYQDNAIMHKQICHVLWQIKSTYIIMHQPLTHTLTIPMALSPAINYL